MPGFRGSVRYFGANLSLCNLRVVLKVLVKQGPLGIHFLKRGS